MVIVFDRNSGDLTVLFVVAEPGVIIWNSLPEPKQIYSYRSGLERPNDFVWILHVCQPFVLFSQVGSRYEFTGNNKCLVLCPYGIKGHKCSLNMNCFFVDHNLSIGPQRTGDGLNTFDLAQMTSF